MARKIAEGSLGLVLPAAGFAPADAGPTGVHRVGAAETGTAAASAEAGGVSLGAGWQAVLAAWRSDALMAEQTAARLDQIGARFTARLAAQGVRGWGEVTAWHCQSFVSAANRSGTAASGSTQHLRRSTVRAIFRTLRTLGLVVGDPTLDLALPQRSSRGYRPLTDDEVMVCRASARLGQAGAGSLRRAVAWALGEATATTSEIGAICLADLLDTGPVNGSDTTPVRVQIPPSRRHAGRIGELTPWGSVVLRRHARELLDAGASPDTLLAYSGTGTPGEYHAQASVCTNLTRVLQLAGIDDPAVRARSLRGWAGQRLYASGLPIEQVAVRLGCSSLDAAAAEIGMTWKPNPSPS